MDLKQDNRIRYIDVPRSLNFEIKNIKAFYKQFFELQKDLLEIEKVRLDFSHTSFISGEMTVLLSMVVELLHSNSIVVEANHKSLPEDTKNLLSRNGFFKKYKLSKGLSDNKNTTIKLTKLNCKDEDAVDEYIENKFLVKCRNEINDTFQNEISIFIFELVHNVLEHSNSSDVIMCGQHYPNRKHINFAISDIGTGLPKHILSKKVSLNDEKDAINWAFKKGNTTKNDESNTDSGVGLAYIKEKIKDKASLKVISNNSYFHLKQDGTTVYQQLDFEMVGTLLIFDFDIEKCNKLI